MTFLHVMVKDLRLLVRDAPALLFTLLVPIVVVGIIAESRRGDASPGIRLPVVNEDEGPVAEVLIEMLGKRVDAFEVDRAEAERLVAVDNEAAAALIVPDGTSKRYLGSRPSTLTLLTDPARGVEIQTLKAYFMLADRDAASLADPLFEELLVLEERNATGSRLEIPSDEQYVPGFSVMFVLMGVYFGVAFGLRDEATWGVVPRLRIAPVRWGSIIGGKLLARFLMGFVQFVVLFAFGRLVFGISLGPSVFALAVLLAAIVFSLTGFSLLIASFARGREQIVPLGLTAVMVVCSVGGCWWPLYEAPQWLQDIAHFFVTAWAMDGIHDLILREKGLGEILPVLGVLVAYGAACLGVGARLYRFPS